MPPIINSCAPACKFWFPRSYIVSAQIADYESGISWADNVATVTLTIPFVYYHVFVFNPLFWEWNSNVYSLDFILSDAYFAVPPLLIPVQTPVDLSYQAKVEDERPLVRVGIPGAPLLLPVHAMPPAPSGWWSG